MPGFTIHESYARQSGFFIWHLNLYNNSWENIMKVQRIARRRNILIVTAAMWMCTLTTAAHAEQTVTVGVESQGIWEGWGTSLVQCLLNAFA